MSLRSSAYPRALLAVFILALALWAGVCLPAIAGRRTFFLRDVFTTHLILKAFGARELAAGRIPAVAPAWGLGQPFRGNPNALPYYPGNLFYLLLPFWSAFNLHYALHWLLAFLAMLALARGLGASPAAALLAGLTYAGSGWMLSALSFYNLLTVAAWWPLVLLGGVRGGRRGVALGGLACGLALLGGEPVAAAIGLLALLTVAVSRHGRVRGLLTTVLIAFLGALLALPQLVALLEVLPWTVRGGLGMTAEQAAYYALRPVRLLDLLLPFPFGRPTWIGPQGVWANRVLPTTPLILTLYAGIVGLWLAGSAARKHRLWAGLALAGLLLATVTAHAGPLLVRLSFGLFRFPEKFLFLFALALPLLAGFGLDDALARAPGLRRTPALAGGFALALAALLALATPALLGNAAQRFAPDARAERLAGLEDFLLGWVFALAIAGLALLAAAWAAGRGRAALVCALQLAALAQLWPLVLTDSTAPYREPAAWARKLTATLGHPPAALDELTLAPHWRPEPPYRFPPGPHRVAERVKAADLGPAPGLLHGQSYPLAPDLEGLQTIPFHQLLEPLPHRGWPERALWMRLTGVEAAVLFEEPGVPDLALLDRAERYGVESRLYAVRDPAPFAWWPERTVTAKDPAAAREAVVRAADPLGTAVVPLPVRQGPGRVVSYLGAPDRIEILVEGQGGVLAIRRAWLPLYEAEAGGRALLVMPVDLALLGVVVPPGLQRVVVTVRSWPEWVAGGIALLGWVGVGLGLRRRPRRP